MKFVKNIFGLVGGLAMLAIPTKADAQIVGVDAYLIGNYVEIGVNDFGHEGAPTLPGSHERGAGANPFGFVANPQMDGWLEYDGDFFTPGTPENGFGWEFGGTRYYSNGSSASGATAITSSGITDYTVDGDCIYVTTEGTITTDVTYKVVYKLKMDDTYYTTSVTVTNNTGADIPDFYYYRNFDPDNNQTLSGSYTTNQTLVNQPSSSCDKALVSAEQTTPWDSYVGLGAIGDQFRVTYGGFTNRDASDIWNAVGFVGAEGSTNTADEAISLAHKIDNLADGATETFSFVVILDADQVEAALENLYFFDYSGGLGGPSTACSPTTDTVETCAGIPVNISITGAGTTSYDWVWSPGTGLDVTTGPDVIASPSTSTLYTATGTPPLASCLTAELELSIFVEINAGPQIEIVDPGPQCGVFDLDMLVVNDINSTPGTTTTFHGSIPSDGGDMSDLWPDPPNTMVFGDMVWVMIADPVSGCYDVQPVFIDFSAPGAAGNDSTVTFCGTEDLDYDLHDMIQPGANVLGTFTETTSSGAFSPSSGVLSAGGLDGTFIFTYTVAGTAPCPADEATFTVNVLGQPTAEFSFTDGISSSLDGPISTCILNTIDCSNLSTTPAPGSITGTLWSFGDGGTSTSSDPSYDYTVPGDYFITLTVTSNDGCVDAIAYPITLYADPVLNITANEPSCYQFSDGSVTVNTSGGSGSFTITISDDFTGGVIGAPLNIGGTNTANTLGTGWYYVSVVDATGCSGIDSVFLDQPGELDADLTIINPLCFGDATGIVMVDTVYNVEGPNNAVSYFWSPNPAGIGGLGADSSYSMPAGDYTLTINDENGCSNVLDFTLTAPPALYFTQFGSEPAYCRQFGYQSGNGVVFAAAGGGTPDYTYQWVNNGTGDNTTSTTWGGLNPGSYTMTVTDDNGCVLSQTLTLDSLNPIAEFEMTSPQFGQTYEGTLPVDVTFINQSLNFANPNNPNADTTFFWNFDHDNIGWYISEDYNEALDTTYGIAGTYTVCLVAINKNGCTDTTCKDIIVYDPIEFEGVNIFSPDGDGINDEFTFFFKAKSIAEFNCVIFDRWGVKVGELTDIAQGWDGTDMNGSICSDGVYFYIYTAVTDNGTELEGQGDLQIINSQK